LASAKKDHPAHPLCIHRGRFVGDTAEVTCTEDIATCEKVNSSLEKNLPFCLLSENVVGPF
jgi:hypothetical protein